MTLKLIAASLLTLVPLAACSSAPTARRYDDDMANRNKQTEIEIFGSVARACHIDPARTYFGYNQDQLDANAKQTLVEVADCMKYGPLAGRAILVTGYTDATGTRDYNAELGLERSRAVAGELVALGIDPNRIYLRSRGERGATDDPSGMAWDRKVELSLVERDL